ncbi:major royal jelly family protein [Gluconobacter frateurii]|uniref:SMP-30/gluconolactonase/LRE family protein n=1 Tax=Gluconobacter frateurii TaxID=38308 RepID=UPI001F0639D5|nr:major royal jelly family protein [Gluconobacter frateurii]UMM09008.1 major royal jelly family protein [Gluconobacter frateurii]
MTFQYPAVLAALLGASALVPSAYAADTTDKGYVSSGNVEIIGRFQDAQPSGIAALPDGRLVLGFPRSVKDHSGPRLATYAKGRLTPFPDTPTQDHFVSPLGMTVDAKGHLWALDEGMLAGKGTVAGAQKLFEIDPGTNKVLNVLTLSAPSLLPDSHVNDVRIDLTHGKAGTAFITDTSTGIHPALIVVDLASGRQRRILADTKPVMAETGFVAVMDSHAARYDANHPQMPQGGANGIGISPDQQTLYWQPQTSRRLYSAPTSVLSDWTAPEKRIEAAVHDEGETGMGDGMATGPDGSLYITDDERHAILRHAPDGTISVVAHDPRMIEPDGLTYGKDGLYSTIGQWARLPDFHGGKDMQELPYIVVKVTLPKE